MKTQNSFRQILLAAGVALAVLLLPTTSQAVDAAKANSITMNLTTDWTNGVVPTVANALRPSWNNTPITAANNLLITLGGDIACVGMDLRPYPNTAACPSLKIGSGNTLGLNGTVIQNNNGGWDSTFNCGIQLVAGNTAFRVQGDIIINGSITEDATPRSLTQQNDSGALHLTAANSYSGGTTISYGILTLGGSGTLGATTGNLTWSGAGILDLGGTTQTVKDVDLSRAFIQNGTLISTSLYKNGPGLVTANLQGATATMTMNDGNGLILSGNNTYGGVTSIGGWVRATKPAALPNSGASGTFTITSGSAFLAVRAGAASGEWDSTTISNLLANASFTVTSGGGALGIDTTGGDFTYGSVIPAKANLGFRKIGPNKLTLTVANLYPNRTTVARGTLKIDAGAGGSLVSSSALTIAGTGTFDYDNTTAVGATSQTLGALNVVAASANDNSTTATEATVQLTRTAAQTTDLKFASLAARVAGGTLNFKVAGTPGVNGTDSKIWFTTPPTASTFIDQGSFFNGSSYAISDSGNFLRAMNYASDTAGATVGSSFTTFTAASANAKHVDLGSAGTITAAGTESINSLRIGGVNTMTIGAGNTLTIANGGILKTGGNASIITGGTGISATGSPLSDLVIRTDAAGDKLTINSPILLNTVTKSGAGTLELGGANTFTNLRLNAGRLNFTLTGNLPNPAVLTIGEGTTLDNTSGGNLTVGGGNLDTRVAGSFTYLGTTGDLTLGTDGNFRSLPNDSTITVVANTLKFAKEMATYSTAAVTKNGAGTLGFSGNGQSQFVGGMTINNGVLAGGPNDQHNQTAGFGPVTLGDTNGVNPATLYLANNSGNCSPLTARAGSSGILALVSETGKSPRWEGPVTLNNALTLASINGSSGTLNMYGVISGGSTLNIGNTNSIVVSSATKTLVNQGVVKLWRINSYTGNTVLNSGTLKLGALGSISNSALVSIDAGATLDVSAIDTFNLSSSTTLGAKGTGTVAGTTQATLKGGTSVSLGSQPIALTFTPTSGSGDTTHPALVVSQGSLTLNNNTISVVNNGPALSTGVYRLIQVTGGTLIGAPATNNVSVTGTGGLAANSYANASSDGAGNVILTVVTRLATSFSGLTLSQTIQSGTASVTLVGVISAAGPTYPADGETIHVTINGVTNDTTTIGGSFSIVFPTATIPFSGTPYPIKYSYDGSSTLLSATDSTTALTVSAKIVPTIFSWPTATSITYGQALNSSTLSGGSASVAGTFSFTTTNIFPTSAGIYAASGTFRPNNTNTHSIVIVPGAISVTVDPLNLTIGSPAVTTKRYDSTTTATITGTLVTVLPADSGLVTLVGAGAFDSPTPAIGINVTPACTLIGSRASNYTLTQPAGLTGDIIPALLTVRASNAGRPAGVANPPLTYTITGYQGADDGTSVGTNGEPVLTTSATTNSPAGNYTITNDPGTLAITDVNYSLVFSNGILRVIGLATWSKGNGTWDIETSTNWLSPSLLAVTYVDGGAVQFVDPTGFGVGPFTVALNTPVSPASVTVSNATKDFIITGSGLISGAGSLTKQGAGSLTLGGVNTYSGGTVVSNGGFALASGNARVGSGTITLAGGTSFKVAADPSANVTNPFDLTGGDVTVTVAFGGTTDLVISGPVSGAGRFKLTGDTSGRRFELPNANTFTGGVLLSGGNVNPRLRIGNINSLGTGTLRSELSGVNGGLENTADLSGGGGVTNTIDLAVNLNVGNNGSPNLLLSGNIINVGSLTKVGNSTLTLSGVNTYGGSTFIKAGTLEIVNAGSLGTGPLSISAGFVQLDDSVNTAQATSLTFDSGATYQATGTWGSSSSSAAHPDDTHFTGSGMVLVGPAATTTTVTSTPITGTNNIGTVTLTATVVAQAPSLATVNEGTVTFTVTNSVGATIATITSGNVALGSASAILSLTNRTADIHGIRATYNVAVAPPNFTTSTSISAGVLTVKDVPVFSNLATSQTNTFGSASVLLTGQLSTLTGPVYPANGQTVTATINGVSRTGTVTNATGNFSITYATATNPPVSVTPYAITYSYAGNGSTLLAAAPNATTTLTVIAPTTPTPTLTGFTGPVAGQFTFTGTSSGAGNIVTMMTTNLNPTIIWTPIQTNPVTAGAFSITITKGLDAQAYYRLMGQ